MKIDSFVRLAAALSLASSFGCSSSPAPVAAAGDDAGSGAGNDAGAGAGNDAGAGGSDSGGGHPSGSCAAGAALTTLPACTAAASTSVSVSSGCAPTIDGVYHAGEWSDAACVTVGGDPVYLKYSGTTLYVSWAMTPVCGCPAELAFNPEGTSATLDGKQFGLGIFDDPAANGGDSFDFTSQGGSWTTGTTVPAGIQIGNPAGGATTTVTYELAIPFSQIGLVAGQSTPLGFTASHRTAGAWPASDVAGTTPPATWGTVTSSANWK
jgi:hypothetical protein